MLLVCLFALSIFKLENKFKLTHILVQLSVNFTVGLCNLHQNNTLEERKKRRAAFISAITQTPATIKENTKGQFAPVSQWRKKDEWCNRKWQEGANNIAC